MKFTADITIKEDRGDFKKTIDVFKNISIDDLYYLIEIKYLGGKKMSLKKRLKLLYDTIVEAGDVAIDFLEKERLKIKKEKEEAKKRKQQKK